MAKASRPGNQAVAGISSEMTDEERYPTYYAAATGNTQSSSQSVASSSAAKGNTGTKSSTSTSGKSSYSGIKSDTGSNMGSNAGGYALPEVQECTSQQKLDTKK